MESHDVSDDLEDDQPEETSERIRRFVEEYMVDGNGTQAYFKAFGRHYLKDGNPVPRSYNAAAVSASRLLRKDKVKREVKAARRAMKKSHRVNHKRIAEQYSRVAYVDPAAILDDDGNPLPIQKLPMTVRRALKVKYTVKHLVTKDGAIERVVDMEVQQRDAEHALDALAKHKGFFVEASPLEQLLNALPDGLREQMRQAVRAEILAGRAADPVGVPGESQGTALGAGGGGAGVQGDGLASGPLATSVPPEPAQEASGPLLPPGGEERDIGGEDVGALFE